GVGGVGGGARAEPRRLALAPGDDTRLAAGRVLAFHLGSFERERPAARGGDVEAVHQLRVATRRLRATLNLFAPVLPAGAVGSAAEGPRTLRRAIGAARRRDLPAVARRTRSRRLP